MAPSFLLRIKESNESKFYTLLSCFCKYKGAKIIDNLVSNFHLPCVRLYYNGIQVKMLPSFIISIYTGQCIDYKYIASTKSPMYILTEKKLKGFGTWINTNEKNNISEFIIKDSYWNILYSDINKRKINYYIYHPISNNSKIIKPKFFTMYINTNEKNNINNDRYNSEIIYDIKFNIASSISAEIIDKFKSIKVYGIDYDRFICINNTGDVLPIEKWIIETTWNLYTFYN
jgi:hypothetical protein